MQTMRANQAYRVRHPTGEMLIAKSGFKIREI